MKKYYKIILMFICLVSVAIMVSGCSFRKSDEVFFNGTKKLLVCKKPYIESNDCVERSVKNSDGKEFVIYFDDGTSIKINDIFCSSTDEGHKVCQGKDVDRNIWDIYKADTVF